MKGEEGTRVWMCTMKRHEPKESWTPTARWNGESQCQGDASLSTDKVSKPVGYAQDMLSSTCILNDVGNNFYML